MQPKTYRPDPPKSRPDRVRQKGAAPRPGWGSRITTESRVLDGGRAARGLRVPDGRRIVGRRGWSSGGRELPAPGSSAAVVRLTLIGGGRMMRGATAKLLASQKGLEVQGTYESVMDFLASDLEEQPGVLLLDCDGDPAGCRTAVSVLSHAHAAAKIVLLCQEASEETISCAMEYCVSGVILKSYSTEDIRHALRYMASGRTIMPAGWQLAVAPVRRDPLALSPRLRQILMLIAQGRSNDEIAVSLALSPNTIKFHVRVLYARLGIHSRVEAALLYTQLNHRDG
jgi:DNA-binding NarL/FixJ family response regulator